MKNHEFNSKDAIADYKAIQFTLGLGKNFSLDQLIKAIEDFRKHPIEISSEVMPPEIYGYSHYQAEAGVFIAKYNSELDEKMALRAKLHELAHIARGDVGGIKQNRCYISRNRDLYDKLEYDVEFIASMWLKAIIKNDLDLANQDWIGNR
jgi:hypothetical protein